MKKNKGLLKFFVNFLIFSLVIWSLIGVSIPLIYDPVSHYIYTDSDWEGFNYVPEYNHSEWNVILDPHSHTFYSDGDLSPRQNLLWHMAMGFNAIVLTDHNTFEGIEEIKQIARAEFNDSIKVLAGMEWTTDRLHMNIILPPTVTAVEYETLVTFKSYSYTPTDEEIQEIITSTHALGGIIMVNHIPWSEDYCSNQPTREQLHSWGIDYIEVVNEEVYDLESYNFCLDNGLGMLASTDIHIPEPVYSWTTLNTTEFTEEAIFAQLLARQTGILFNGIASPYPIEHKINPGYIALLPLIRFGEIFESMYSSGMLGTQLAILFAYLYGIFFLVEGIKALVKKIIKIAKTKKTEKGSE